MNPPPPEIYTLSLHDALRSEANRLAVGVGERYTDNAFLTILLSDRKSTRLNSSHRCISYAVFCLKKKKKNYKTSEYDQTTSSRSSGTSHIPHTVTTSTLRRY